MTKLEKLKSVVYAVVLLDAGSVAYRAAWAAYQAELKKQGRGTKWLS